MNRHNTAGAGDDPNKALTERQNQRAQTAAAKDQKGIIQTREAEVWVKKWVDYSTKYGLGYYLSNEATGVFFNDSTKIILDPNGHHFDYMERRSSDRQDVGKEYTLGEYPKELQKKVTLLQHFWSYLEGNDRPKNLTEKNPDAQKERKVKEVVYVKKWMRTRHAIMFRLSNKVVQVNFQDHTEIMLSSETKIVTYVNKKGERSTYPLNSAMESANLEMVKRLKYTKDILTHMLNANAANLNKPPDGKEASNPLGNGPEGMGGFNTASQSNTGRPQTSQGTIAMGAQARTQATERVNQRPYSSQFNHQ